MQMDKTVVVYYSLDGHTHFVASKIGERLECPVIRLRQHNEFSATNTFLKYFWAGKSSVFRDKPPLEDTDLDPDAYDTLVIATPVWAGNLSSPVRSFLSSHPLDGKRVFLVATNSGGSFVKCFATMRKLMPKASVGEEIGLVNITEASSPAQQQSLDAFCDTVIGRSQVVEGPNLS